MRLDGLSTTASGPAGSAEAATPSAGAMAASSSA